MSYRLTIVKRVPNPNYDEQKARAAQERRYSPYEQVGPYDVPAFVDERVLEVELYDNEFEAVKKAVVEEFA